MAKPWSQVAASPEYQALPYDQQEAARQQYFETVVAPNVPAEQQEAVRHQFNAQTFQPRKRSVAELRQGKGFDPTEGNSFLDNATLGFGKSFVDTGRGIKQLAAHVADAVAPRERSMSDLITGHNPSRAAEVEADIARARQIDAPLNDTAGGVIGNVAGQATQIAVPIPGAASVKGLAWAGKAAPYVAAAARSGAFGALQGTVGDESRVQNGVIDAALGAGGQAISHGGSALATMASKRMAGPIRESIDLARRAGIPLHLSQVTDSKALKTISSALNYLPFSGAQKAGARQQEAFNRAIGRSFGFGDDAAAPHLTDEVMKDVAGKFSKGYEDIYSRNSVRLDPQAMHELFRLHNVADDMLEADKARVLRKQIERIIDNADQSGTMPGQVYQNLRSELRKDFAGGSSTLGNKVMEARKVLDDAAKRSIGGDDAAALSRLNSGYANFRTAQEALKQVAGAGGNVRPAALYPLVRNGSTKEMRELAKIGQNVLKDPIPDSGTASRDLVYRGLGLGGGAAGGAAALGVLPMAAKLAATGITAGRVLNSRTAAKLLEQGKPTSALAKLLKGAPAALPPATAAVLASLGVDVVGGRRATPEDLARDEQIVREFRERQKKRR